MPIENVHEMLRQGTLIERYSQEYVNNNLVNFKQDSEDGKGYLVKGLDSMCFDLIEFWRHRLILSLLPTARVSPSPWEGNQPETVNLKPIQQERSQRVTSEEKYGNNDNDTLEGNDVSEANTENMDHFQGNIMQKISDDSSDDDMENNDGDEVEEEDDDDDDDDDGDDDDDQEESMSDSSNSQNSQNQNSFHSDHNITSNYSSSRIATQTDLSKIQKLKNSGNEMRGGSDNE